MSMRLPTAAAVELGIETGLCGKAFVTRCDLLQRGNDAQLGSASEVRARLGVVVGR